MLKRFNKIENIVYQWKAFQGLSSTQHSKQPHLCKTQEKETNFG